MKKCPYCAEEIQNAAVKCRHCGEVTVSQEWRKFCADYSTWPAGKRTDEFQALSDDQKAEFNAAWTALGLDKAPQATPAPTEGATAKGFKGVIGVLLGLGCVFILLPMLFFGGCLTCVGLGSLAVSEPGEAIESSAFGDEWPFPDFDTAQLDCTQFMAGGIRRPLVIVKLGATWYGLNGAAMGVGGYPDARTKMARHKLGGYELGATRELIQRGIKMCER